MSLHRTVPAVAALLAVCLFVALGLWQLDRAGQKQSIYDAYLENRGKWPLSLNDLPPNADFSGQLGRRVAASGTFLGRYLFLDNQPRNGRPGYLLLAPFAAEASRRAFLVNLGWIAAPPRRDQLPALPEAGSAPSRLIGRLAAPPALGLRLQGADGWEALAPGVYRIQIVDFARIADWLERPLAPALIELAPDHDWGYDKTWRIPGSGAQRHQAYAVQWFSFAAIAALLWLFLGSGRNKGGGHEH